LQFLSTKAFLKETRLCFGISWKMDFCNPALIETKSAVKKQGVKSDFEQRFKGRLCRREGGINKHLIVGGRTIKKKLIRIKKNNSSKKN